MSRNTFSPKSRQQNEREITRIQEDFSGGMFRDITKISENSVADLIDMVSKGEYLETRVGCREWGDWIKSISAASLPTSDKDNGIYFHKGNKKIYIQLGTDLYVAENLFMSAWNKCHCVSYETLSNTKSTFDEYENYLFVFNSGGIFKINTLEQNRYYYKINTPVPNVKITNVNVDTEEIEKSSNATTYPYGRKYVYCMSRITGIGNRNRQSEGATIELESGGTQPDETSLVDYGVIYSANKISDSNGNTVTGLTCPTYYADAAIKQQHWTHYSVYTTKNIGEDGTDAVDGEGNNKELLVWNNDIPVIKVIRGFAIGTDLFVTSGKLEEMDKNTTITFSTGDTAVISSIDSDTSATINTSLVTSSVGISIGSSRVTEVSSFNTSTKELVVTTTDFFSSADERKTIYFSDGSTGYIDTYTNGTTVTLLSDYDVTDLSLSLDPTSRVFTDYIPDDSLEARINVFYTLRQRLWEPLPEANIGIVYSGFMFTTQRNGDLGQYSELPLGAEYICGYYFSPFQYYRIQDEIQFFTKHTDKVVVWCKNSRHSIPTNTTSLKQLEKVGIAHTVLPYVNKLHSSIGCNDFSAFCYLPDGESVLFITNEPGIRIFNGETDTDNLATDRITRDLKELKYVYSICYDPINGVTIWGTT